MRLVVRGIPKNTSKWVELGVVSRDNGHISRDVSFADLRKIGSDARELIRVAVRTQRHGQLTVGDSVINIMEFVTISVTEYNY